jgi:hypothetical protein
MDDAFLRLMAKAATQYDVITVPKPIWAGVY